MVGAAGLSGLARVQARRAVARVDRPHLGDGVVRPRRHRGPVPHGPDERVELGERTLLVGLVFGRIGRCGGERKPIEAGATDRFRMVMLRDEMPPFEVFRVRPVDVDFAKKHFDMDTVDELRVTHPDLELVRRVRGHARAVRRR